jgi:hypothetical protein
MDNDTANCQRSISIYSSGPLSKSSNFAQQTRWGLIDALDRRGAVCLLQLSRASARAVWTNG